ncbi:hypothetical protein CERZMDRAFT_67040 [Cercospora zeae-maydis SCOH1-5]|uniref:Amino acid permease/ SLC12A domain-containing protein n=1 Tax=Cercospora zeae-maydis SCOH1-5 TaxID=717836 RepID=A0A6A6FJX9_9PEZI|nr:hypothetical protein CERZMDRAFT_67040 [Cercospora zeae-maydis SCOH1-5]
MEDLEPLPATIGSRFKNTYHDNRDMHRMNKKQELRRNFRFLSVFGYSLILVNGWVIALPGAASIMANGGPAGGVWSYVIVICGLSVTTLSMAEMASMAPCAGGQYHWVSETAPKHCQKFLSYITGWLCVLGWQTALCSTANSGALALQGIMSLRDAHYVRHEWHSVLLTIAIVLSTLAFNTVLLRKLPTFEGVMFVIYIFGFIAVMTVLWVMGDRASARSTFTEFTDYSGWGSDAIAMWVSTSGANGALIGSDCAAHLAEEVQDAAWVLPRSMVATAGATYVFSLLMVITYLTVKGETPGELLSADRAPYVSIFANATQSKGGAITLTSVIFVLLLFGIINMVTSTSRQLYAFARDRGLPFSTFLSYVRPGRDIPLNAVAVTLAFSILSSLILLGSPIAFRTLSSLCQTALLTSYLIVIACITHRRLTGGELPPTRFSLGKASLAVNIMSLGYLAVQIVFLFFPSAPHPTAPYANWAIVAFGGTVIAAILWYYYRGRSIYQSPVESICRSQRGLW